MDKVTELRQERAALIAEARKILDKADKEKRALTAEERQEYERLFEQADELGERVKDEERQRAAEVDLEEVVERRVQPTDGLDTADDAEQRAKEYRDAFETYIRYGMDPDTSPITPEQRTLLKTGYKEERADQVKGTTTLGGFTVPSTFQKRLIEHQVQAGTMRQTRVTVLETSSGEDLPWPKTTSHGNAEWLAEATTITPDAENFGQFTLKSYVSIRSVLVSEQLLADNAVNIEEYLGRELGRSVGALQNTAYFVGNGSNKPTGIATLTSLGQTAASATAIAADELMDVYYSVSPPYRRSGEWAMSDSTIKALRKLKLADGSYIWVPGLVAGESDTLLGKPVHDDPDVPAIGTGNKSVLFGDFSAYVIRDAGGFVIRRLNERYADKLMVGFLGYTRTDGYLGDQTGAVKHLLHP